MTSWGDEADLRNWLVDYLVTNIGSSAEQIDLDAPLNQLGLGSRDAVVLARELSEMLGRPVSPVDFWENPTINALAHGLLNPDAEPTPGSTPGAGACGSLDEPIAVIGLGCRLPAGIHGPDAFWQFLAEGRSTVGQVPDERWQVFDDGSAEVGTALARTTRWGSFLEDVAAFDAQYFDISPSEADRIDPQQRLLLEVAVEALDHAGIPPESLRRTQTGVFAGACVSEYGVLAARDLGRIDAWTWTGGALSIIANRLSYFLDVRGPSITVDTACSSSLVAIHLACQSLRTGESDLALAAGVNVVLSPAVTRSLDAAGAMSQSGACRAFDAGADGFVRGEGCGVVVLKRLSEALRDGNRVLAVVRGSAINQDGRSNGLMAPNPAAQTAVLRAACADAGVEPSEVDYVEAHGTGTLLGDPIEARGLGSVYGRGRAPDRPLLIGSVKTNVGHLEAAAGVTGFIKATLAVQRGRIPANLHFDSPNPHIPFEDLGLRVVDGPTNWPSTGRPRRAGVSSFGFGGTNAHLVLEQPPALASPPLRLADPAVTTLLVAGNTPQRVARWASVLAEWMDGAGAVVPLPDIAHTVNHHRSRHGSFATVAARTRDQAVAGLRALAAGQPASGVVEPHHGPCSPGVVFVYSGQGSQWAGMGRQLLADEPAFATAVDELEPEFVAQAGFSLKQVLSEGEPLVGIDRIQPVLVAVQLALTALWRSYGIRPDAVIGHSMGEVSAAVVSGALSAADGLRVVATRSRLLTQLSGTGAMALVELEPQAAESLADGDEELAVTVYASPRQSVIAGPPAKINALIAELQAQNLLARLVDIDVASHHPTIDPVLADLRARLADLTPGFPTIPVITTTYEHTGGTPVFDADHWAANLRNPVRFSQAIGTAGADHATFIEISPHPLLTHAITDTLADTHHHSIGTLQRDAHDTHTFHTNHNAAHTTHPPQTPHLPEPHPPLPSAPWQHTDHWISASSAAPLTEGIHPLLGAGVTDPTNGTRVWENRLSPDVLWLGDHCVDDACVLPGAACAELALAAVTDAFGARSGEPWTIRDLRLDQMMHVTEQTVVVTTLTGDESRARVEIRSRGAAPEWIVHAIATLERDTLSPPRPFSFGATEEPTAEMDPEELYERLRSAGQQHGPAFRGIVGLTISESGAALARLRLPSSAEHGSHRFLLHPVMVDIALQALGATKAATDLLEAGGDRQAIVVPVRLSGIRVYGDVTESDCAVASLAATSSPDRFIGQVTVTDSRGRILMEIDEVETRVLRASRGVDETDRLFTLEWEAASIDQPLGVGGAFLVVGDLATDDPLLTTVRSSLDELNTHCQWVSLGEELELRAAITRTDIAWDGIVVLCPARAIDESLPDQTQLDLALTRTLLLADIVKTVSRMGARNSPRLWIVTRGAQQLDPGAPVNLAQTPLRGLARVLTFEHPELKTTIVDVDAEGSGSAAALVEELLAGSEQDEVALRDGQRYVHRLVAAPTMPGGDLVAEARHMMVNIGGPDAFRLQVDQPGRLDGVKAHAVKRIPPQAHQIEVRVVVAGLNFADVLKAMGLYPGQGEVPLIGAECVGVVTALGQNVDSVQIGQRVIAFGPGTFGSHLTTLEDLVIPIPDALPDGEAATFGIPYLTAWHSLREVARLAPGERVLIHSATGGVGLAAVCIAKMIGAHIYTTAGSDAKRELLCALGVEYVGDSRSMTFADEILDATDGYGVDVILNSLPGEAIRRGVQILAPGGRFIELGKKDVYANAALGLAALAKSASFSVVDLDLNLRLQPNRYRRLLQEILAHAADGDLRPLPITTFSFDDVIDAFRMMASGSHIGKILITLPVHGSVEALAPQPPQPLVVRDGGYIVVGGLGGLGLVTARWLAQQGAGMVVLNGRSAAGADALAAIADMKRQGTRVEVVTGDIADSRTAGRLVNAVDNAGFRLAGVLHSATVLADEIVLNMSDSAAARVFAPKVTGSWRLHEATADRDLDWWLTFSSAASLLGSPGQGAYAAANAWVDGLVAYRRSRGLPAVGINWGPWAEVGRAQFFADLGFSMITPAQGLAAMQLLLAADLSRTGVFSLDARQWFQSFPSVAGSSLLTRLRGTTTIERGGRSRIRAELDTLDASQRPARLASAIADEIRAVLRSSEPIDHNDTMDSLGLDSLMALELRNRLEARLGITLPAALVWAYPTITDLAGALCERLGYPPMADSTKTDGSDGEPPLSDEEIEMLSGILEASELEATTGAGES